MVDSWMAPSHKVVVKCNLLVSCGFDFLYDPTMSASSW